MFQFIDARLQPAPAEVTNGFVHEERAKGSGRELGDGDRVRPCARVLLLGWKPFLRRSLAQKNHPGEEFQSHLSRRVATSQEKSGHVIGKAAMCWD